MARNSVSEQQHRQLREGNGFLAALDQSGGSTPKALRIYGIPESAYDSPERMFELMHEMRQRMVCSPAFRAPKIAGAILFEDTLGRHFAGKPAIPYLWEDRGVIPFLKVDKGLEAPEHGVRLMKPIPDLADTLARAREAGVFGTKMRSVIDAADAIGIKAIVEQQFTIGRAILDAGLVPILEPEVTISIDDKTEAEAMLLKELVAELDTISDGHQVMFKLTLPNVDNHYRSLVDDPHVLRVFALSGGFNRTEANRLLARNSGMAASFSRALAEGLEHGQTDQDFDAILGNTIDEIFAAGAAS